MSARESIAVMGGGPVGLAFALALRDRAVTVFEQSEFESVVPREWDARVYAISPGSRAWLESLDAWQAPLAEKCWAVDRVEVTGDDGRARLHFARERAESVMFIVEERALRAALVKAARRVKSITLAARAEPAAMTVTDGSANITFADGRRVGAPLVVGADGGHSWVRQAAGLAAQVTLYGQQALVANVASQRAIGSTAYQWFFGDGSVLAFLPIGANVFSIVWSVKDELAGELRALAPEAFAERLTDASRNTLGPLRLMTEVKAFPLKLTEVPHRTSASVVLVGDAAHTVHPLAGQGVNLGFQDARALAETLGALSPLEAPGDASVLRRYERARAEDTFTMQFVTDGLTRLFAMPFVGPLRNRGLTLVDRVTPLKRLLLGHALR